MKEQKRNFLIFLFLFLFGSLLFVQSVSAVAIGVSRADLVFEEVLRAGYAEETVVVSTDSPTPITAAFEVEGDIAEWVRFIPENANESFEFSANSPQQVTIIVEPSADAANGEYEGLIRVITGEISRDSDGQFGTSTRAAFGIDTTVDVTDTEVSSCVIGGLTLQDTEITQPIDLVYRVENTGNVRVQPELDVIIYDMNAEDVVERQTVQTSEETLPTTTEQFIAQVTNTLEPGQYWAQVSSDDCSGEGFRTFDVLERGGIADQGEFLRFEMESFVETGEIVPITAVFENKGARTVSAKLKGSILIDDKLVKVIDTDFYDTPPGEIANIETFFNPQEPGRYEVKGRVFYNNKLTFERIGILNVSGEGIASSFSFLPVLMILIILFLLVLIRRKRNSR